MNCCAILALLLIWDLCPRGAKAQQQPFGGLTQQFSSQVVTANQFTSPSQMAANAGRQTCLIEYLAATPTATPAGYVYFGAAAPAATSSAFQLANKGTLSCGSGDGTVDTNTVWVAGTATNDIFVFKVR
jgi:hypothetical protein